MRLSIALGITVAGLAFAGAAQAASWTVALGDQGRPPAGTPKTAFLDQMMPGRLTINSGDSVTFSSFTFHTATYLGAGRPAPLFVPDPAKGKYTGINDSAGQPFYFDGLAKLVYNGQALGPYGGTTVAGKAPLSTGVLSPSGPKKPATATLTFPKAGTFHLICQVHPGMQIAIVVKPAGAPVPSTPTQVKAEILKDLTAAYAKAKAEAAAAKPPKNTVYAGVGSSSTLLTYFPDVLTVKVGTTVNFVNKAPTEVHNVTFGPSKWVGAFEKKTDIFPMGPKGPNQVNPVFPYGSEPKGKYQYDGTNHGNGFLALPLTAGSPHIPLPRAAAVTFTKPGKYKYICLIHGPDMNGTVIVTP